MSWHRGLSCLRDRGFSRRHQHCFLQGLLSWLPCTWWVAPLLASSQDMPCRRARHVVTEQAGDGLRVLQTGVRDETEFLAQTFSNGIGYVQQGPRQIQAALSRVQRRIEESRLQALLEVGIAGMCKGFWLGCMFMGWLCVAESCWLSDAPHGGVLPAASAGGGNFAGGADVLLTALRSNSCSLGGDNYRALKCL